MTVIAAKEAAKQLQIALQDNGVRRVSIELQPGVGPKADPWGVAPFVRGLGHHIASYPTQGDTPGLAVVKGGRTGASPLQGPLANCYGGFDLTARIITLGWANHPGAGGPWSVPGWGTVPLDNGRPYILGWEFEGGYLPYTDEMHDFMARCGAGTLDFLGWLNHREPAPLECWDEHKGWAPLRKIDRFGYTTASGRQRISAVRNGIPRPSEEDEPMLIDVAPSQTKVIPLPVAPAGKAVYVRFSCDDVTKTGTAEKPEYAAGSWFRVAGGRGLDGKNNPVWWAISPDLNKGDGYSGWLQNAKAYEVELDDGYQCLSVTHKGTRAPLGVLVQIR